jgi:hypothetical protein
VVDRDLIIATTTTTAEEETAAAMELSSRPPQEEEETEKTPPLMIQLQSRARPADDDKDDDDDETALVKYSDECDSVKVPAVHGNHSNNHNNSRIINVEAALPLGVGFTENDDGSVSIAIVIESSHGDLAGLRWNDRLLAVSACPPPPVPVPTMAGDRSGGDGIGGGDDATTTATTAVNNNKERFMYPCDQQHLEDVLAAIQSNEWDLERRPMLMVIERTVGEGGEED